MQINFHESEFRMTVRLPVALFALFLSGAVGAVDAKPLSRIIAEMGLSPEDYQVLDATTSSMLAGGTPSVGQERNWVNEKTGTKGTVRIRDVKDNCVHFQHFVQPSGAAPNPEIRTRQCKDASGNWILTP
ncbi:hypothetical protein [Ruegeria arenilitoris]|uniref:hypothetical protein n=1 Tax=Ruegeria arenilitoris TaxID=1173585 RepID=UPI003463A06B